MNQMIKDKNKNKYKKISEIKNHFGNLIDDETAKYLALYKNGWRPTIKLSDALKMSGIVTIEGIVIKIFPRTYKHKKKKVRTLLIKDDIVAKVKFWNETAKLIDNQIFEGIKVRLHCYIKNGILNVSSITDVETYIEFTNISELIPEEPANIKGRISGIGDPKRANEIFISDETGRIKAILWDDKREIYYKVDIGDLIEIINSRVKISRNGEMEIHIGKKSRVKLFE